MTGLEKAESLGHLAAYGAPYQAITNAPTFRDLKAITIKYDIVPNSFDTHAKERPILPPKQHSMIDEMVANPVNGYVTCISGTDTDRMAKFLAAYIMNAAVKQRFSAKWLSMRPYTTTAFDNLFDQLDRETEQLIILSNVIPESTSWRLEAVRDIVEHSNSQLKSFIIVTAGMNPHEFMTTKMRLKPTYGVYISSSK